MSMLIIKGLQLFEVSVPGSLMLFGEHAVLHGKMAIVAAIDARLKVTLIPHNKKKILINTSLEDLELDLNNLEQNVKAKLATSLLSYVLESINYINQNINITSGFNLQIADGNLKKSSGFGSSAAVVVGVLLVMNKFFSLPITNALLFKQALQVVHKIQDGLGSGADIAASIYGGIIAYQNFIPQKILMTNLDLIAIYCGYKTKTADVIKIINHKIQNSFYKNASYKNLYNYIFASLDDCSKLAIDALEQLDLNMLGALMNIAHGLLSGLGVVDVNLDKLATTLRAQSNIYGAKISGAGLGDCVIGLGTFRPNNLIFVEEQFMLKTTNQGAIA